MNHDNYRNRVSAVSFSFVVFGIVLIIFLFSLSQHLNLNEAQVVNYSTGSIIDNEAMTKIRKTMYSFLKNHNYNPNSEITIRTSSAMRTESGFVSTLIDVDSIEQTYRIRINPEQKTIVVACPSLAETKYPNTFCEGGDGEFDDTLEKVLGKLLPYEGTTPSGYKYSLYRYSLDRNLYVREYACAENDTAAKEILEAVRGLIKDNGGNPDIINKIYEFNNC